MKEKKHYTDDMQIIKLPSPFTDERETVSVKVDMNLGYLFEIQVDKEVYEKERMTRRSEIRDEKIEEKRGRKKKLSEVHCSPSAMNDNHDD